MIVVRGPKVINTSSLLGELKKQSFAVRNIRSDEQGLYVYLHPDEVKDPEPLIESWLSMQSKNDLAPQRTRKLIGPISIVTAVSREKNLPRIFRSMEDALHTTELDVRWILVFDAPGVTTEQTNQLIKNSNLISIVKVVDSGGPMRFGIRQKNLGIDLVAEGFYHCLDDDNIVHPDFFREMYRLISENPSKLAFGFGQIRWDFVGDLKPYPWTIHPGMVDNTMFVVHKDLIGDDRYEPSQAGSEDGFFFKKLHEKKPEAFLLTETFLAYYNYLSHYPNA